MPALSLYHCECTNDSDPVVGEYNVVEYRFWKLRTHLMLTRPPTVIGQNSDQTSNLR